MNSTNCNPNHPAPTPKSCQECRCRLRLPRPLAATLAKLNLEPTAARRLLQGLRELRKKQHPATNEAYLTAGESCKTLLAATAPVVAATVAASLAHADGPDAIFVSGLPDLRTEEDPLTLGSLLAMGFACTAGQPFQYSTQNDGRLVGVLRPKPELLGAANTGEGSGEFQAHSDDAIFAPIFSTEHIQLTGMVNDSGAATYYVPVDELVQRLASEILTVLRENRFVFKAPRSFNLGSEVLSAPSSILFTDDAGRTGIRLPTYNCAPARLDDAAAQRALAGICAQAEDPAIRHRFVVGPGTALIFNNNRGLHSREAFQGARVVLRTYVRGSLDGLRAKARTPGSIFDPELLLAAEAS